MIGSDALESVMGSRAAADKHDLAPYIRALAKADGHVLFLAPKTKKPPLDMRTAAQKRTDNADAQEAAKARGVVAYQKVKAPEGVYLATNDAARLARQLTRATKQYGADQINLGLALEPSRLVVVDADTPEQVNGFAQAWRDGTGTELHDPTVRTPGVVHPETGERIHHGGGHWYFRVPDGVTVAAYEASTKWVAKVKGYVVVPPSTRAEGAYTWTGSGIPELPPFLRDLTAPKVRSTDPRPHGSSPIDVWGDATEWAALFEPYGWTPYQPDNCGCPTWTRPGGVADDARKSITAHHPGCSQTDNGHAHLWSDSTQAEWGGRSRGYSKIQVAAHLGYGGDVAAACAALGIPDNEHSADAFAMDTVSSDPYDEALELAVFEYSEVTKHIRDQARDRLVSPWSALFVALMHAILSIPYWVRLPAIVGGEASFNSMLALVGGSGGGKGVSDSVTDFVQFVDDPMAARFDGTDQTMADAVTAIAPGSGEALSVAFRDLRDVVTTDDKGKEIRTKKFVTIRRAALFSFAEVDSTTALMQRNSSTLSAELRKMWDGKSIGVHTKTVERRSSVEAFSYRAAATFGVQPERAEALLDGEDGGLPQRLLWAGTADPHIPDDDGEGERSKLDVPIPGWGRPSDGYVTMTVAQPIHDQIRRDRRAVLKGTKGALTGLHSHRNLVRLKLAAAVAVLHGRGDVSEADWEFAEALLTHSDRVRASVQRAVGDAAKQRSTARGVADAHREQGRAAETSRRIQKAADGTAAWLRKRPAGPVTRGDIQRAAKSGSDRRLYLDECLTALIDDGVIRVVSNSDPATYELVTR
ncbi:MULTISPECIES: bifunctional DNA primase/polymerase [unclassified Rhodococcus (in: high G+C Gram-positive bacteria)]|uniref:bifunctional DNA primase/polymerase n=1 Tax=unclassified Rhodococcus (in: high G+C Gram-positive bacteria) TaxID=192944 RepID=UPI000B9C6971|nr:MULTISPECIES: bifunctional DNA primase/polymerase [unclassified Rhodococcus (in: high G+C Gram-positive bacteria)]OZE31528.1 hypothetical protein CH259_25710 [Rhodococcus sp. 05-2254-4]OZE42458.1 hypothetical protein CH261_20195 [Rhodococcus sp. 05-2254-3]OZE46614.1 hypothetical protein CH283_19860 [Rhodococcus sp. 05-2254-2]